MAINIIFNDVSGKLHTSLGLGRGKFFKTNCFVNMHRDGSMGGTKRELFLIARIVQKKLYVNQTRRDEF